MLNIKVQHIPISFLYYYLKKIENNNCLNTLLLYYELSSLI